MLIISIPEREFFDEANNEFSKIGGQVLRLEHSLVSLSKWESKWKKAFLTKGEKTVEESRDYVRCMTITQNVDPNVYGNIDGKTMNEIMRYIEDPHTATTVIKDNKRINNEVVTSEVIYYWMVALQIPWEAQRWHLNRLLTLINVCNLKNNPKKKKMTRSEILARNRALNEQRKAQYNTTG